MSEPNLDHLGVPFGDCHHNIAGLVEYLKSVDVTEALTVPKDLIPQENYLDILKPGSKEVVTWPVHIPEYLPPMYPLLEVENDNELSITEVTVNTVDDDQSTSVFKKPAEIPAGEVFKRPRSIIDEEQPPQKRNSVIMTSSGFILPAHEGKLPESRTALLEAPPILTPQPQPTEIKNPIKIMKQIQKKDKVEKLLFKNKSANKIKKEINLEEIIKNKIKPSNTLIAALAKKKLHEPQHNFNKTLSAARFKTEQLNTTITPIPMNTIGAQMLKQNDLHVDELFSEPDNRKANIFKKSSNAKKGTIETKNTKLNDFTIELIETQGVIKSRNVEQSYFDNASLPGTSSAARTPEMLSHCLPLIKEKQKQTGQTKIKKLHKQPSPTMIDSDMDFAKTAEALVPFKQNRPETSPITPAYPFPVFSNFGGPGLIPTPLFSHLPLPFFNLPSYERISYWHTYHPLLSMHLSKPPQIEEAVVELNVIESLPKYTTVFPTTEQNSRELKKEMKKKNKAKRKAERKKLKQDKNDKAKNEKKEKPTEKEAQDGETFVSELILGPGSSRPEELYIKKLESEVSTNSDIKSEMPLELGKISPLVTSQLKTETSIAHVPMSSASADNYPSFSTGKNITFQPIPKLRIKKNPQEETYHVNEVISPSLFIDPYGNKIWFCPTCGEQDDGSPMIGCDDCDGWYHWICVGIQVPPGEKDNWYCNQCINHKQY